MQNRKVLFFSKKTRRWPMSMLRKSWEWEKRLWSSQLVWRHSSFSEISFVLCLSQRKSQITTWFLCYPLKLTHEINPWNHLAFEQCTFELPPNGVFSRPLHQWNLVRHASTLYKVICHLLDQLSPKSCLIPFFYKESYLLFYNLYSDNQWLKVIGPNNKDYTLCILRNLVFV